MIASSWSDNPRKGAATFEWLDRNLDHDRFELTFVGRSSVALERAHDDPGRCRPSSSPSFSVRRTSTSPRASTIRARTRCSRRSPAGCRRRLPRAAATRSSSAKRGCRSPSPEELPALLARLADELDERRAAISVPSLVEVADRYLEVLAPMSVPRALAPPGRAVARGFVRARTALWRPRRGSSRSVTAAAGRSTRTLRTSPLARARLGIEIAPPGWARFVERPGRLPHEPVRSRPAALARLVEPARRGVPPRPAGHARDARVRPLLRRAAAAGRSDSRGSR